MTTRTATRTLLGLWFLTTTAAAAACDDSTENRKAGPTPTPPPTVTEKPSKPPPQKPPTETKDDLIPVTGTPTAQPKGADISGIVRNYSGCYSGCFKEGGPSTNRETCKLNCDSVAESALEGLTGAPPRGKFKDTITTFTTCVNGCYGDKTLNRTNRETCVLTCQDTAEIAASTP